MIKTFKIVTRAIYSNILFDQILAPPICNEFDTIEVKHYHPDDTSIYAKEMDNFTCNNCKVSIIYICMHAYYSSLYLKIKMQIII